MLKSKKKTKKGRQELEANIKYRRLRQAYYAIEICSYFGHKPNNSGYCHLCGKKINVFTLTKNKRI